MLSRPPSEDITLNELNTEHVRVVREDSVSERIDPRISPAERASQEQLDEPYLRQLSDCAHHDGHTAVESDVEKGTSEKQSDPLYVGRVRAQLTRISRLA